MTQKIIQRELDNETLKTLSKEETGVLNKRKRSGNTVSQMLNIIRETRSQAEEQQQVQTLEERQKQVLENMLKQPGIKNPDAISKRLAA